MPDVPKEQLLLVLLGSLTVVCVTSYYALYDFPSGINLGLLVFFSVGICGLTYSGLLMLRPRFRTFDKVENLEDIKVPELNFFQRFDLRLQNHTFIGLYQLPGWRAALPFYVFECKDHGLQVSRPHGFSDKLKCPVCFEHDGQPSQDEG